MKKLLDVTDRRTGLLQLGLMGASGILVAMAVSMLRAEVLPTGAGLAMLGSGVVLFIVTAGIKQRWEIEYRGHRIRFENSPVTGEKLFLDEGLVARGGVGIKMELRAQVRIEGDDRSGIELRGTRAQRLPAGRHLAYVRIVGTDLEVGRMRSAPRGNLRECQ